MTRTRAGDDDAADDLRPELVDATAVEQALRPRSTMSAPVAPGTPY